MGKTYHRKEIDMETVFIGIIEHKFGRNVYVHKTEKGLNNEIDEYIKENWDKESLGKIPSTSKERIAKYFSNIDVHGESIEILKEKVDD